jgi:hypothetical protein
MIASSIIRKSQRNEAAQPMACLLSPPYPQRGEDSSTLPQSRLLYRFTGLAAKCQASGPNWESMSSPSMYLISSYCSIVIAMEFQITSWLA